MLEGCEGGGGGYAWGREGNGGEASMTSGLIGMAILWLLTAAVTYAAIRTLGTRHHRARHRALIALVAALPVQLILFEVYRRSTSPSIDPVERALFGPADGLKHAIAVSLCFGTVPLMAMLGWLTGTRRRNARG